MRHPILFRRSRIAATAPDEEPDFDLLPFPMYGYGPQTDAEKKAEEEAYEWLETHKRITD